jgi:hypothetical protein
MRSFGRLRSAPANSRPTISAVAPASANIGRWPALPRSARRRIPAPGQSSSRSVGWRFAASFWASPVSAAPDYGTAQQSTAAAGRSAWLRSPAGLYNRRRGGAARIGYLAGTVPLSPGGSDTRHDSKPCMRSCCGSAAAEKLRNRRAARSPAPAITARSMMLPPAQMTACKSCTGSETVLGPGKPDPGIAAISSRRVAIGPLGLVKEADRIENACVEGRDACLHRARMAGCRRQFGQDRIPDLSLGKSVLTGVQSQAESAQAISASSPRHTGSYGALFAVSAPARSV